jgi:F0F1-type ATP synthase membrane subunit b/b'
MKNNINNVESDTYTKEELKKASEDAEKAINDFCTNTMRVLSSYEEKSKKLREDTDEKIKEVLSRTSIRSNEEIDKEIKRLRDYEKTLDSLYMEQAENVKNLENLSFKHSLGYPPIDKSKLN